MATIKSLDRRSTDRPNNMPAGGNLLPPRQAYRPREMGVGYGRSSGYASDRHYADLSAPQLFRCR